MLLIEMPYDEFMSQWYNKDIEHRKTIAQNAKTIKKLNGEKRRLLNKVKRLKTQIANLKQELDKNKPKIEIAEIIYESEDESKVDSQ